ncbi:DgyrCDS14057 [Dimorphilus gyrociliatus]|uniref:DgyrCDS14057 n=2 Tax=Dimorphilus gyrociliatus TaxID=2664684 RepID=A0A7I8WCM7_9ANNE|nr:DgyrCDS14057 [Dimorphilus gyrociliatus]
MEALRHTMITSSGSQYLHPEYIQPLPTTLDAKKSPLALLAQTCSAIGKDTAPTKSIIPPIQKEDKTKKDSMSTRSKSPKENDRKMTPSPGARSNKDKSVSPKQDKLEKVRESKENGSVSPPNSIGSRPPSRRSTTSSPKNPEPLKVPVSEETKFPTATPTVPGGPLPPFYPSGFPLLPHHSLQALHSSALASHTLSSHKGSPVSPFMSYTRVKTPGGASSLVPVCRDPFCTNCQIMMQHAQLGGTCPAGCTQCSSDKLHSLATLGLHSIPPSLLQLPSSPYVCNWVSGSDYCGKRFSSSEELFQHLRTHTGPSSAATAATGSTVSPADLAALYGAFPPVIPPSLAPSLSPSALRNYPTSLSPNSAMRYHPYKPSSTSTPTTPSISPLSAAAYCSPYSVLYPRLGAAAVP